MNKIDIISKYRPIVISKKKYYSKEYDNNQYNKLLPIINSTLSNLSESLLNPFDYIDSKYFNLSHQQTQTPILTNFTNMDLSNYIILQSIMSRQSLKYIYFDNTCDLLQLKQRLNYYSHSDIYFNNISLFDDLKRKEEVLIFITDITSILNLDFWKNKDGCIIVIKIDTKEIDIKKASLLINIMDLSNDSYIEIPPNYSSFIYIIVPNMCQNFHHLYKKIDSIKDIEEYEEVELNTIFEKVFITINNLINSRNRYQYNWTPEDAEYISAINLNFCYSICKKYGLQIDSNYLNEFGQLKEIKLLNSRYITKYFPIHPDGKYKKYNLQITNVGLYSITKPYVTEEMIKIMKTYIETNLNKQIDTVTITDATAGVGGDAIAFCNNFKFVNVVEIIKIHADIVKNNLDVYQHNNYKLYHNNYLDIFDKLSQDVVYLDSPWGGVGYKEQKYTELYMFGSNLTFNKFVHQLILKNKNIILFIKCPINYNVFKLSQDLHKINLDKDLKVSFVSNFLLLTIY